MPKSISIIVPTFNEIDNIEPLIKAVDKAMSGVEKWEIIFVDDNSPDGTYHHIQQLAKTWQNVRCLRRFGRRGLASATIEGMLASSADLFVVMDGDLQHDEGIIPKMADIIEAQGLDLVVASRFIGDGSTGELASVRVKISQFATMLSQKYVLKIDLSDPMSGFFMLTRQFFEQNVGRLSAIGFKILLDLVASAKTPPKFVEVPYKMRVREQGLSKLEPIVVLEYLLLLLDKTIGKLLPLRFMMFVAVGLSGVVVHFAALWSMLNLEFSFLASQGTAAIVAMTTNYLLNNIFTYRDKKLSGWGFLRGLISFYMACSIGLLTNLALSNFLFQSADVSWWLAGFLGAMVGSIWNYGATKYITWR